MECQFFSVFLLAASFILLGVCTIMLWNKVRTIAAKNDQAVLTSNQHLELEVVESRMNDKIAHLERLLNSQSTLISIISTNLSICGIEETVVEKKSTEKESTGQEITKGEENSVITSPDVISRVRYEDAEKKLESLLNDANFTKDIWPQFSESFYICAEKLVSYLSQHGLSTPRIDAYPPLKENNPNFWTFMVVQAMTWRSDGKQFVIPRNYVRYDPLWHQHTFEVRGNTNKADNFINGLVRCAMLKSGMLTGNIDKSMVDLKGIISVE